MDREILFYVVITTVVLTVIGGFYLGGSGDDAGTASLDSRAAQAAEAGGIGLGSSGPAPASASSASSDANSIDNGHFAPDDIRYKFQQESAKAAKRHVYISPSAEDEAPEQSENEAPPIEDSADDSAEAPPIE